MRRLPATVVAVVIVSTFLIPAASPAAATGRIASLVNTIDTSAWAPPSPDPAGVAWWAAKGRLIVVDSEVEEMAIYAGANTFEASTDGTLIRTSTTFPAFSAEPTDVAADANRVLFVDDGLDRVFIVDVGTDGDLGTADDSHTSFSTRTFNSHDPEGLAFGAGIVFVSDGNNRQVYRVDPGSNGLFDGTDDRVSCFDTSVLGMRDPEGVTMHPSTGELYVVSRRDREIAVSTTSGVLTDLIDVATVLPFATQTVRPSGVAVAPASDDASRSDVYIADRRVDNDADPSENDGKVYQVRLDPPSTNLAPVVSGPGPQPVVEGEFVRLQIVAADPNDDPISFSATGLPPGLTVDPVTGVISGTIHSGAASGTPYASTLQAHDGSMTGSRNARWDVAATGAFNTAPTITNPGNRANAEGEAVSLPIVASDPDPGNVLMYSAMGLPPGLWMDCLSGVVSGTIAPGATSGSPYRVRVSVSDQVVPGQLDFSKKWDAVTFTWTVATTAAGLPPTITSFSPASGPVGTTVTIEGTNFTGVTSVAFGGVSAASFTVGSSTRITAVVPPGATTGPISVTNANGTGTSATDFTVTGAVHDRIVKLTLRRHLVARGRVSPPDGFAGCYQEVRVRIQRRVSGTWRAVKATTTNAKGVYRVRIPDRPGRYGAVVPKLVVGDDVCRRARSPVVRHA